MSAPAMIRSSSAPGRLQWPEDPDLRTPSNASTVILTPEDRMMDSLRTPSNASTVVLGRRDSDIDFL